MDFTLKQYKALLEALIKQGYLFQTFEEFSQKQNPKVIVLRHDLDKRPQNSPRFAKIQTEVGIKGTYYFRMVAESWDEVIIKEIASLGHEIGYHYETMDTCKGDFHMAYKIFCENLSSFRKIVKKNSQHSWESSFVL
jgi:hypothetical protein